MIKKKETETTRDNLFIFSLSKSDIFFVQHIFKFIFLIGLFGMIWEVFISSDDNLRYPTASVQILLPMLIGISFLWFLSRYNQAKKIIFDLKKETITIFTFRAKAPYVFKMNDLHFVKISRQSNFIFKNNYKFWFRTDPIFLTFLKEKKITRKWDKWGKFFFKDFYKSDLDS